MISSLVYLLIKKDESGGKTLRSFPDKNDKTFKYIYIVRQYKSSRFGFFLGGLLINSNNIISHSSIQICSIMDGFFFVSSFPQKSKKKIHNNLRTGHFFMRLMKCIINNF